jgi:SAM-dependent methyltransferase
MRMDNRLANWLRLREPADTAARSIEAARLLGHAIAHHDSVRVLDLGTGTGANIRYLVPHLPPRQHWVVVDRDPSVLALLPARMSAWVAARGLSLRTGNAGCVVRGTGLTCEIETLVGDLHRLEDRSLFAGKDVVTASALLDLASERWLRTLARQCRVVGATVLFALSYNGGSTCSPAEPEDETIRELLNRHQLKDKGLGGPAAGPAAAELAPRIFREAGYTVHVERTDWMLGPAESEMQRTLVDGWGAAATQLTPDAAAVIDEWRLRRLAHIDSGRSQITVGHVDMAAWLPA